MVAAIGLTLVIAGGAGLLVILAAYLNTLRATFSSNAGPDAPARLHPGSPSGNGSSDELFAELYSLRDSIGEMASEIRAVRLRLEALGDEEAAKTADGPDGLSRVA